MIDCACKTVHHRKRIVLTGGPGAGKTALLALIKQSFCKHVEVLPEAASVLFGGGFPRDEDATCRRAAQRAIFHVQRELETVADNHNVAIVLCDRGTIDGLAYWPGEAAEYWSAVGTTIEAELARYHTVIHLRTPRVDHGYNHQNPLRTESPDAAAATDARIDAAWSQHPRRFVVESSADFLDKAAQALALLRNEVPECCRKHSVSSVDDRPGKVSAG
ncbi:MAG: ATP-binding protein [Cyanobacteria bacterium]|nr:ATP-binding protein [Cyanobacteriota bacterium]